MPLAPEVVDAILDGRQSAELQLDDLLVGFPMDGIGRLPAAEGADDLIVPPTILQGCMGGAYPAVGMRSSAW